MHSCCCCHCLSPHCVFGIAYCYHSLLLLLLVITVCCCCYYYCLSCTLRPPLPKAATILQQGQFASCMLPHQTKTICMSAFVVNVCCCHCLLVSLPMHLLQSYPLSLRQLYIPKEPVHSCFCCHCLLLPLLVDAVVVSFVGVPVVSPAAVGAPLPGATVSVPAGRAHGAVPVPLLVLVSLHQPDGLLGAAGRVHMGRPS